MSTSVPVDLDGLRRAAASEADRLVAEGVWTSERDAEVAAAFERAAVRALRVPTLAERSLRLRRLGRRVVPTRLRPAVRAGAARVDRLLRRLYGRVGARRS